MLKRRTVEDDGCDVGSSPAKRLATVACPATCDLTVASLSAAVGPNLFETGSGQTLPAALTQDGTLEIWLAVAAQVQDALAALPGWIHVAQNAQVENKERFFSFSNASTPSAVQQHANGEGSSRQPQWQQQSADHPAVVNRPSGTFHPEASSSDRTNTPAAAIPAEVPAQPAAAAADSCTSDCDTVAACGWFSKCRGCCQLTAGEIELRGEVVPLCRGCSNSLHRRPAAEREQVVHRIMRAHAALCQREATGA